MWMIRGEVMRGGVMMVDGIRNQPTCWKSRDMELGTGAVSSCTPPCRVSGDTTLRFFGSAAVFAHQRVPYGVRK